MADDDSRAKQKRKPPARPDELEEIHELPEFPDRAEFVKTMEMDSTARDAMTRPMQPVLDRTTQRYEIPEAIMELARQSQVVHTGDGDWEEFTAELQDDGTVVLPASIRARVAAGHVTLRIKLDD